MAKQAGKTLFFYNVLNGVIVSCTEGTWLHTNYERNSELMQVPSADFSPDGSMPMQAAAQGINPPLTGAVSPEIPQVNTPEIPMPEGANLPKPPKPPK